MRTTRSDGAIGAGANFCGGGENFCGGVCIAAATAVAAITTVSRRGILIMMGPSLTSRRNLLRWAKSGGAMRKRPILAALVFLILAPGIAAAQGQSQGRGRGSGSSGSSGGGGTEVQASATVIFTSGDHDTFRNYFTSHKIIAEPLPPGIAKNVARGKALPPGIAKKALPADLVLTLGPRVQPGVTFAIAGDRVVALKSGLVIDVMVGVFK